MKEKIYVLIENIRKTYENNISEINSNYIKTNELDDCFDFFEGEGDEFLKNISFLEKAIIEEDNDNILEGIKNTKKIIKSKNYFEILGYGNYEEISNNLDEIKKNIKENKNYSKSIKP